jgi:hypothetical protein
MKGLLIAGVALFAALPATTNYKLNSYGFGSGGTAGSSTTTYKLEGTTGELSGSSGVSTHTVKPAFIETQQANVPKLSAFDNNSGQYYNRLHFVIDTQSNPTSATYLISVSTSSTFASNVQYVQADGTLTATLSTSQYQTYSAWGGSSGSLVVGLNPSTTYYARVKATQGRFTESAWGPSSSATTGSPSLTFSLVTSSQPSPPFSVSLGTLTGSTINSSADTINTTLTTNGASGGDIYVRGQNGGLLSGLTGYKINGISTDLSSASEGFGAQSSSATQISGGPFTAQSPYSVSGTNVGIIDTTTRSLYSANQAVTGGSGQLLLKAKAAISAKVATDYQDVLTFIAAGNF